MSARPNCLKNTQCFCLTCLQPQIGSGFGLGNGTHKFLIHTLHRLISHTTFLHYMCNFNLVWRWETIVDGHLNRRASAVVRRRPPSFHSDDV